jgi:Zn-dependent M28 family amino/carboxypeptidase
VPTTSHRSTPDLVLPEGAERAVRRITQERLRAWIETLADDRFEGRGPGSAGDVAARAYIAEELGALGYVPAGPNGTWEQPFDIVGVTAKMPETWRFTAASGTAGPEVALAWWDDFIAEAGVQRPSVTVDDAEVVFCGYGITAPEEHWDDFKGADLRGKILLVLNNDPDWDPELFAGERRLYYGRWSYKFEEAGRQGAAGVIIIHTTASAGYPWGVVQTSWHGEQFDLPQGDDDPRALVNAWATEAASRRLAALGGHDLDALVAAARSRDFRPVPLGVRTSLKFDTQMQRTSTANVLGLLEGSDPTKAQEMVVLTAHHDHLGIGDPDETGDEIYNGARDNASGVALALGVAEAIAALPRPPRRSVLVLLVGAEEHGLLGSHYYARHPTISPPKIAANLNFELGNIWGKTKNVIIHGKGKTDLDRLVEAAAAHQGRRVEDEPDPDAGWFYRSDQFSFARIGVPSIWFESGRDFVGRPPGWGDEAHTRWIAEHYHRPTDEVTDDWSFEGMLEDAQLAFWVAASVATADEMPTWMPGDEFAHLRAKG